MVSEEWSGLRKDGVCELYICTCNISQQIAKQGWSTAQSQFGHK